MITQFENFINVKGIQIKKSLDFFLNTICIIVPI